MATLQAAQRRPQRRRPSGSRSLRGARRPRRLAVDQPTAPAAQGVTLVLDGGALMIPA